MLEVKNIIILYDIYKLHRYNIHSHLEKKTASDDRKKKKYIQIGTMDTVVVKTTLCIIPKNNIHKLHNHLSEG